MPNANDTPRNVDPARALNSMMDMPQAYLRMLEAWRTMAGNAVGLAAGGQASPDETSGTSSQAMDPATLMKYTAQSYMTVMGCAVRCWSGWSQLHARYLSTLSRSIPATGAGAGQDPQDQGVMIDNLRAFLREVLELPVDECRRAMDELQKLDMNMLPPAEDGQHPRRWKAKP